MRHRIFVDLTSLIAYAAHFNKISGVQRLEIELLKSISDHQDRFKTINVFDGDSAGLVGRLKPFLGDDERLLAFLRREFSYCGLVRSYDANERLGFLPRIIRKLSRPFKLRMAAFRPGDVLFVPGGFGFTAEVLSFYKNAISRGARLIFLVHDSFPITRPDCTAPGSAAFFAPAYHLPADIITTTFFNAADYERAHRIVTKEPSAATIHVVPLAHEFPGATRNAAPVAASQRPLGKLQGRPFVLCVGTVEVRKNHLALLNAWRELRAELGEALPLLVIAGRRGWHAEEALAILDEEPAGNIPYVFIEGPTDEELKWLYASCLFSILPSLFEGWGLPIGESFWFGKACAASNAASIPEVGRDLCLYFDPVDQAGMKSAIRQLLDPAIRKGFEDKIKAADLRTWRDVARDLIGVVEKIAD